MSIDGVWIKPTAEQAKWFNEGVDTAKAILRQQEAELAAVTTERDMLRNECREAREIVGLFARRDGMENAIKRAAASVDDTARLNWLYTMRLEFLFSYSGRGVDEAVITFRWPIEVDFRKAIDAMRGEVRL